VGVHDDVVLLIPALEDYGNLGAILAAITPEVAGTDTLVLVANHDGGRETPRLVAHLTATVGVRALCLTVPEPGAAAALNTLIRAATSERPGWRWIVMVDDAAVVHAGWLASMIEAGGAHGSAISRASADSLGDPWFADSDGSVEQLEAHDASE
jgi:CTP:molybdopterin cytidylyltransferase MocA